MRLKILLLFFLHLASDRLLSQNKSKEPQPSRKPGAYQLEQIKRKYGMFIHFGINTFYDEEWTDGSKPPSSYMPLSCLLYTSDAADERSSVDLGGRRIIK